MSELERLDDVARGVYAAFIDPAVSNGLAITRDDILKAVEEGVRRAMSAVDTPLADTTTADSTSESPKGEPMDDETAITKRILSVEEAERTLGIGHTKFYQLLNSGEIASFNVGRRRLVPVAALDEWIARKMGETQ